MSADILLVLVAAATALVAFLAWRKVGWRAGLGAILAGLGAIAAVLGLRGRSRAGRDPGPPPLPTHETTYRTAGDIVREHEAERQAKIKGAADPANPGRLDDLADLGNERRRRR